MDSMGSRIGIYPAGRYSVLLLVPFRIKGLLAQMVEQVTLNHRVGGSIPSQPTYASKPEKLIVNTDEIGLSDTLDFFK